MELWHQLKPAQSNPSQPAKNVPNSSHVASIQHWRVLKPATESNPYIRPIWHKLGPIAIVIIPGVSNGCFTFMAPWKPVINVAMELWTPISTRKELRYYCTFKKTCVMRKVSLNGCQSCQIPPKIIEQPLCLLNWMISSHSSLGLYWV